MRMIPPMIQWHEGMFLSPHHFQQLQRRFEALLSYQISTHHSYCWGVLDHSIDHMALPDGVFSLKSLDAIMPDLLVVDYPSDKQSPPLSIDLNPYKIEAQSKPLKIYFAVPEYTKDTSPVMGEWPRYRSIEGELVSDENLKDNVVSIPQLVPLYNLIISDTYPSRYVSFPIAEFVYRDDCFQLTSFIPPLLKISPHHSYHERGTAIAQKLREKAMYLSDRWQKQTGTVMTHETAAQLRPMVEVLPMLEGFLRHQTCHPHDYYHMITAVIGRLSTLRLSQVPPLITAYNHDNVNEVFPPLFDYIDTLIDGIEQQILMFPFHQRDRLFYLKAYNDYLNENLLVGLKAPSGMTEEELADWMKDAVIASDSFIDQVRLKRMAGAARKLIDREDLSDYLISRGMLIFSIDSLSEFIKPGENINIFNVADSEGKRPSSIVLYVKQPHSDQGNNDGIA